MAVLPITEIRRIIFPRKTLLEALQAMDRRKGGPLADAFVENLSFVRDGDLHAVLVVDRNTGGEPVTVEVGGPQLAAAMILYCVQNRVPLPRSAEKRIELAGEELCLRITIRPQAKE